MIIVKQPDDKAAVSNPSLSGRTVSQWLEKKMIADGFILQENGDFIKESDLYCQVHMKQYFPLLDSAFVEDVVQSMLDEGIEGVLFKQGLSICLSDDTIPVICKSLSYQYKGGMALLQASDCEGRMVLGEFFKREIVLDWMKKGVNFIDIGNVYIDDTVEIGEDVTIYPGNHLYGQTKIACHCVLEPNNIIYDSLLFDGVTTLSSVIKQSEIGAYTTVGPSAYLRPKSIIGEHCRIGDFVEIKNSTIGNGTKVSHLTYVGDADIGEHCNVGCGVVFANYDGTNKFHTHVGNRCFIGSNCNLVAPVSVGDKTFIAAGTTVTKDTDPESFMIGRVRAENKVGFSKKYIQD